jgi:ABC-type uncharacterized transport system permease subunit
MRGRLDSGRIGRALAAPAIALVVSLLLAGVVLRLTGWNPWSVYGYMLSQGVQPESLIRVVNLATPYYISALAVAIGFKMGLFNIGVEGQYRLAALCAAAFGAAVALPAPLHVTAIVLVAVAVGAVWALLPAVLKVWRGVSEVISTILLNTVAAGVTAYLLINYFRERIPGANVTSTELLPRSAWFPSLSGLLRAVGADVPEGTDLYGFVLVAIALGVAYHVVLSRTRFGFNLRASGINPWAAQASGVDAKAMVLRTMAISGAIAGLVGMTALLSDKHLFGDDFPTQLGFTGIGVALLGRNHPVGMALGAVLFGFLDATGPVLQFQGISKQIVLIMQGVLVLAVVIAYEVVRRVSERTIEERAAVRSAPAEPAEVTA